MMLLKRNVADDVVVNKRVSFRPEVPWLLFWVVRSVFETCELVFEVYHVECLFISQCIILILSQNLYEVIIFSLPCGCFNFSIRINLRDRIISRFLFLNCFRCDFLVHWSFTLKFFLLSKVGWDVSLPIRIVLLVRKENFIRSRLSNFLILCWKECHNLNN